MRGWDTLFILLVLAPIVTGGVWLHRPGFHAEYTQPGIAALVLSAWLWWQRTKGRDLARESIVCRQGLRIWNFWKQRLIVRPVSTLLGAWLFFSLLWFLTSLIRHLSFGSGLADLGIFTNGIWNVSQIGFPYSSIKDGRSLLADHQIFLLYPLGWIFSLWRDPIFLLLIQAFGLCSGAIALYFLGRQRLGTDHPVVPWLPIAFWLCGPLRAANRFDFHPEVLMLPLFLFALYLLQEEGWRRRISGFALLLAAIAAKESAGPVACGIGLAWALGAGPVRTRAFTRKIGLLVAPLGATAFIFDIRFVPTFFGATYSYLGTYGGGASASMALRLFTLSRLKFLIGCLLPVSFLPLFAPLAIVAAVPGFLMLFLTEGEHRISLGYHYSIEPMVGLLFALPVALESGLLQRWKSYLLPLFVLASLLSFGRSEVYFWRVYSTATTAHHSWLRKNVLPEIIKDRSVVASYGLVPHLATRHWVHQVPTLVNELKVPVDCVAWDTSVNNTPMGKNEEKALSIMLRLYEYSTEFQCGSFTLFRKKDGERCLAREIPCPEKS